MRNLLIIFLFIISSSSAQGWEQTYNEIGYPAIGKSVKQTSDGGFIVCGYDLQNLIKIDENGTLVWSQSYNGLSTDLTDVIIASDGGFVACGGSIGGEAFIMKADSEGNMIWSNNFTGGETNLWAKSIYQTSDYGYIMCGVATSVLGSISNSFLIKTDSNGNLDWFQFYFNGTAESVQQNTDGTYVFSGTTYFEESDKLYLCKTTQTGDVLWSMVYGENSYSQTGGFFQKNNNGGYILCGNKELYSGSEVYLINVDEDGNQNWSYTYGSPDEFADDFAQQVQPTSDGGYIVVGSSESSEFGNYDVYLLKTDENGIEQWSQNYGLEENASGYSVQQTFDAGYIISGSINSENGNDAYLIKTDDEGNVNSNNTNPLSLYPIEDPNFLAFLQDSLPQVIYNDSLNIDATNGIGVLNINSLELTSIDGIQFFSDLWGLACWDNQLTSLPELPQSLTHLGCSQNELTSLPELPESLTFLNVDYNQLSSLLELPQSLTYLGCSENELTSLPELPQSLTYLGCAVNQLTILPELSQSLTCLNVWSNQLTHLPELPQNLDTLSCSQNELTSLPELPESLTYLDVGGNQLTYLPELPQNLGSLYSSSNQLTSLPELPQSLTFLRCFNNQLTSLPELPQSLTYLSCYLNELTSLPDIPNSLVELYCAANQITQLPLLPIGLIFNNDLPLNHFSNNPIECVNNYLSQFTELYQYPLCSSLGCTNINACNWNSEANIDDGSCIFAETYYDCNGLCLNDTDLDGICDELEPIEGCTYSEALNFDEEASFDDGSCIYEFNVSFDNITNITNVISIYNIYIVNLMLDSTGIDIGDLIGVFYLNDGILVSGGYVVYDGTNPLQIAVVGDDPNTLEIEGFVDGQEIIWIVQQTATGINYIIDEETENGVFTPNTEEDVLLDEVDLSVTLGCTNPTACNYNPLANLDDGTCKFPGGYYDCLGNCINDIDMDGECDEFDYDDGIGIDELEEDAPKLIKMIDILGREHKEHKRGLIMFYVYDNGSVKKRIVQ